MDSALLTELTQFQDAVLQFQNTVNWALKEANYRSCNEGSSCSTASSPVELKVALLSLDLFLSPVIRLLNQADSSLRAREGEEGQGEVGGVQVKQEIQEDAEREEEMEDFMVSSLEEPLVVPVPDGASSSSGFRRRGNRFPFGQQEWGEEVEEAEMDPLTVTSSTSISGFGLEYEEEGEGGIGFKSEGEEEEYPNPRFFPASSSNQGEKPLETNDGSRYRPNLLQGPSGFYTCPFPPCRYKRRNRTFVESHVARMHSDPQGELLDRNRTLRLGVRPASRPVSLKPKQRRLVISRQSKLKVKPRLHVCSQPNCGAEFKLPRTLERHVNEAHAEMQFECQCGQKFRSENELNEHGASHVKGKRKRGLGFPCSQCGVTISRKRDLARHIKRVHLQLKPFECTSCDRKFAASYDLRHHMKHHEEIGKIELQNV